MDKNAGHGKVRGGTWLDGKLRAAYTQFAPVQDVLKTFAINELF